MLRLTARWGTDAWPAPVLFLLALLLFSINLDRPPHPDELHHVLAAQHLLETGHPSIAEGEYWRGIQYTWLVAVSYALFGDSLASARIPSVLLVALVAPILFLWVRREAGSLAAWLAAIIFISSPFTVEIAQFSRFYSLQMFSFVLGSLCVYYCLVASVSALRRLWLGVLATVLLALAVLSQVTTLVGMLGVAAWGLGVIARQFFLSRAITPAKKKSAVAGLIVAGVLVILVAISSGALESAWEFYRQTNLTAAERQNEYWFYYIRFLLFYPTLWTLVGAFALLAVVRSPRLAWLAISVFSISFLLMSFAGPKATRYLSFASPFLAIVWGVGLAHASPLLQRFAATTRGRLMETLALPQQLGSIAGTAAIVLAAAIILLTNPFWLRTAAVIGDVALPFETPTTDWRAAREALASWTADADIMITTEELGSIYFLGRSDVRFSLSKLKEQVPAQRHEFGLDFRTGRPIITKPESVDQLIQCFPRGFVVGPIQDWGNPILISEAVQAVITRYAEPIEVPAESHLYAWGWERKPGGERPGYCSDLDRFSGRRDPR